MNHPNNILIKRTIKLSPFDRVFQSRRTIQTTAHLQEIVKVPPFADSVSEGDVR